MEKLAQLGTKVAEFLVGQFPDPPLQTDDRDRLELLKMEHPGLEKRLGDRHLGNGCSARLSCEER